MVPEKITHISSPATFLDNVFSSLDKVGIDVSNFFLDHICYRMESEEAYEEYSYDKLRLAVWRTIGRKI